MLQSSSTFDDTSTLSHLSISDRYSHTFLEKELKKQNRLKGGLVFALLEKTTVPSCDLPDAAVRIRQTIFRLKSEDVSNDNGLSGIMRSSWEEVSFKIVNLGNTSGIFPGTNTRIAETMNQEISNELTLTPSNAFLQASQNPRMYGHSVIEDLLDHGSHYRCLTSNHSRLHSALKNFVLEWVEKLNDKVETAQTHLTEKFCRVTELAERVAEARKRHLSRSVEMARQHQFSSTPPISFILPFTSPSPLPASPSLARVSNTSSSSPGHVSLSLNSSNFVHEGNRIISDQVKSKGSHLGPRIRRGSGNISDDTKLTSEFNLGPVGTFNNEQIPSLALNQADSVSIHSRSAGSPHLPNLLASPASWPQTESGSPSSSPHNHCHPSSIHDPAK